ncbi:MAG: hypothetical protein LUD19_04900 [Clostridia bacterium]|nr:hypothetical protein [Clostridia bacterium]
MAEEIISEVKEEKPEKQNFFKSTSFKCIIVLLAIVLVCGIILTICNDLFEVTDEEKLNRTLSSFYGEDVNTEYIYDSDIEDLNLEYTSGTIETTELEVDGTDKNIVVFKILSYASTGEEINDYLLKVTGTGGYSGGSVTCWIAFTMNSDFTEMKGVRSVSIDSNVSQSYISKIKSSNLEYFSTAYDGANFDTQTGTGASFSMGAITNAVNLAMEFVNTTLLGAEDIYASFEYTDYIDKSSTEYSVNGDVVTYNIKTTGNSPAKAFVITITVGSDKTIESFEITTNGSTAEAFANLMFDYSVMVGMDLTDLEALIGGTSGDTISTGATRSNELCVQAALFAVANYDLCISGGAQ